MHHIHPLHFGVCICHLRQAPYPQSPPTQDCTLSTCAAPHRTLHERITPPLDCCLITSGPSPTHSLPLPHPTHPPIHLHTSQVDRVSHSLLRMAPPPKKNSDFFTSLQRITFHPSDRILLRATAQVAGFSWKPRWNNSVPFSV